MKINKEIFRKNLSRLRRKKHIRKKVFGSEIYPRLSVFRSLKNIYIQAIDDYKSVTILSLGSLSKSIKIINKKNNKSEIAFLVGKFFGMSLLKKGINKASFDRNGFKYTGRIEKLVEGMKIVGVYIKK